MAHPFASAATLGLAVMLVAPLVAQAPVDPATLGPKVGERAIPFALSDQTGNTRELSALAGPSGTMLVFFRSADW